jgi:uncharacterized repeat protein (TIGR01451 family)
VVLNGVAMVVPADQVGEIAKLPNVEAVYPDELLQPQTDNSPQFIGAPTVWSQLGGQESSGDNVVVGVIDTGIWPEHPSFSDPDPSSKAYGAPPPPLSGTRQCQFSGGANPGPAFTCNNKLVGAYRFMSTYTSQQPLVPGEYTSARDDDGHGTHTASTAAGNGSVQASIFGISRGIVSGITPRARVIAYKVCGLAGCYGSDSAAAVQQAILNGVNVINFSISGGANPYTDAVEQAFLDAYAAGVFVAASAGNAGPTPDTTDHRGPWVTTVAASTQNRAFETTATIVGSGGVTLTLTGTSITQGITTSLPITVPITDTICLGPFSPGTFTGKVVVCKRGNNGRADKGYQVFQGGAAGMILYNQSASVTDVETDNHYLPAVQIQYSQGQSLLTFLAANPGATTTWPAGVKVSAQGDVMASFSSRGGPGQTVGVSKPDITAPGVQILAGASPQHIPSDTALGPEGEWFQAIAGTSMSSPHIAGAGALMKAQHPDWTPGQIKSALMTTAWTQVVKEDGTTPANAFDDGSGRVNLNVAGDPGLTFGSTAVQFVTLQNNLWDANYPSVYVPAMPGAITVQRTAHSLLGSASQWKLEVKGKSANDFTVTVPPTLAVPAGGDAPFNIVIDGRDVPLGQVRMATLYLTQDGGSRELHIPITFVRREPVVTLTKTCSPDMVPWKLTTSCTITATNTSLVPATVNVIDQLPAGLTLVPGSVVGGLPAGNGVSAFTTTLAAAQPPNISIGPGASPAGYLPLSGFGVAPIAGVSDEFIANFTVPAFTYAGETYTRIGIVSNGYAVVGGGTGADIDFFNQSFPNPTPPNNVLAPFWTDLNPGTATGAAGALRIGTLTDGVKTWLVLDWEGVREYSTASNLHSFQIWIGLNSNTPPGQDISFTYGSNTGNGDGGLATVGAENRLGNRGGNYYYNGAGTLPVNGTQLRVTGAPPVAGGKQVITFAAQGATLGSWVNYAEATSDLFQGTNFAGAAVTVFAPNKNYAPLVRYGTLTR